MRVGDLVKVTDTGHGYTTYEELFEYAVKWFNLKNVYFQNGNVLSLEPYRVIALTKHLNTNMPIAVIADQSGRAYLYEHNGLRVI